ncbi:hypothetical protein LZ31DRAFT_553958 [Colletotrichum somersetense]|nr:hypothetical protein LZ31DRAFT_553958 [Colletotrichum somersetense]
MFDLLVLPVVFILKLLGFGSLGLAGFFAWLFVFLLKLLGFGPLGPIAGTFATFWQAWYGGAVPAGGLFALLQRVAMTWFV